MSVTQIGLVSVGVDGKQFTGRLTKPYPADVLFERICRENGISTRLTKPRSPTTGKIERWHKTLRRELLDAAGPYPDLAAAQTSIDAWVHGYNHSRPHQSLGMAHLCGSVRPGTDRTCPGPHGIHRTVDTHRPRRRGSASPGPGLARAIGGHRRSRCSRRAMGDGADTTCTPAAARQSTAEVHRGTGRRTVWADNRSIHVVLDRTVVRTRPSRLFEHELRELLDRGARIADPEAPAARSPSTCSPLARRSRSIAPSTATATSARVEPRSAGPSAAGATRHPAFRWCPNARPCRWPTGQVLASAAGSEPPRRTSRNATGSGAAATTGAATARDAPRQ
jgi:Integrase core domain